MPALAPGALTTAVLTTAGTTALTIAITAAALTAMDGNRRTNPDDQGPPGPQPRQRITLGFPGPADHERGDAEGIFMTLQELCTRNFFETEISDLAPIADFVLATVLGSIAVYIAFQQWKTHQARVDAEQRDRFLQRKYDLFDRRWEMGAALLRRPFSPLFIGVFAYRGCLFGSFYGGQA